MSTGTSTVGTGASAGNKVSHAGAKVIVASKLPMALELQLCVSREQQIKNGGSVWTETIFAKDGPIVTIHGTAYPNGQVPDGMPDRPQMAHGAALTYGVDKDFFDRWLEQNKTSPIVVNRLVFAHEKSDSVKARAREVRDFDSGLGPLNPENDRRMPRKLQSRPRATRTGSGDDAYSE